MELDDLKKMRENVEQAATSFEASVHSELNKTEADLNAAASEATGDPSKPGDPPNPSETPKVPEKMV